MSLMDINNLLALVEDLICPQNMTGQGFGEEAKKPLALGSVQVEGKQCPEPEMALRGPWKDGLYRQCLYLQLEHIEQALRLAGPRSSPQRHSHARALRQLQTLKGCLGGQQDLLVPACTR
uniref:Uncharacterized protein n=1 Tax=Oryctolagus cuniculus TaxID=9986 RepID=A0A5F9CI30_RABIT